VTPLGTGRVVTESGYALDFAPRVLAVDGAFEAEFIGRRPDHAPRPVARFFRAAGATPEEAIAGALERLAEALRLAEAVVETPRSVRVA